MISLSSACYKPDSVQSIDTNSFILHNHLIRKVLLLSHFTYDETGIRGDWLGALAINFYFRLLLTKTLFS